MRFLRRVIDLGEYIDGIGFNAFASRFAIHSFPFSLLINGHIDSSECILGHVDRHTSVPFAALYVSSRSSTNFESLLSNGRLDVTFGLPRVVTGVADMIKARWG